MDEIIEIEYYETDSGTSPYLEWEAELSRDLRSQVHKRLNRVRLGNLGDINSIDGESSLYEFRLHVGPGYRIYFGRQGKKIVVLLCAGDKGSQKRDILRAKKYWRDCF